MSYLPGNKLSSFSAGLHATVLTDGKVMMTHGLGAGQILKLEDWLILAGDDIAVFSNEMPDLEPVQENPATIGSKFRWQMNNDNYRVAIMTSNGLLQVKSVTDGVIEKDAIGRVKTRMFVDEKAWRASLPQGKAVTELVGPDTRTELQKRIEQPLNSRFGADSEKLNEIMDRFKIRSDVITTLSQNDMLKATVRSIEYFRAELNKITMEEELAGKKRHQLSLNLNRILRIYSRQKSMTYTTQTPDVGINYLYVRGTNRLRTNIGGTEYEVGLKGDRIFATKIAIRPVSSKHRPAILYNSLAEMGNPKVYMIYRNRRHELTL